jgi:hypothetical protein
VSEPETIRRRPRGNRGRSTDAKEDLVTDCASPLPRPDPTDTRPDLDLAPATVGIDPEDTEVVPAALTGLVTSARTTYRTMQGNGCYPAIMAVSAVEDTVATLARIGSHLEPYVGDYSGQGGKAVVRASDLLGQARSALSDARHHLALDLTAPPDLIRTDVAAPIG